MEQGKKVEDRSQWSMPLKVPLTEVIDLLSDEEDTAVLASVQPDQATRDASEETAIEDYEDAGSQSSIWEDILNSEDSDDMDQEADGGCTKDEAVAFKRRLRILGEDRFLEETVGSGAISAKRLLTAFGIPRIPFLEGLPDQAYYSILGHAICRELSKREKLPQYNTIDDAVTLLKDSRNIIILTGAGISTSLGIPDFRSKETGLYTQLAHLGLSDPQEVFDISIFRDDPSIFYSVAKDILPTSKKFSPTHAFIRLLQDEGKLLTNFTQNIDNLEAHAGILPGKLIQCHGSFATATCIECKTTVSGDVIYKDLHAGRVARCDECLRRIRAMQSNSAAGVKRKRPSPTFSTSKSRKKRRYSFSDSDSNEDDDIAVAGVMKPDITFFGEDLPSAFHNRLFDHDRDKVDLVLVIGTSLKVAPVSEVVGVLPQHVPQIYINRDPCAHVNFDVDLLGECDAVVAELCRRAGWDLKHEMCTQREVSVKAEEGYESRWHVKVARNAGDVLKTNEDHKTGLNEEREASVTRESVERELKRESSNQGDRDTGITVKVQYTSGVEDAAAKAIRLESNVKAGVWQSSHRSGSRQSSLDPEPGMRTILEKSC